MNNDITLSRTHGDYNLLIRVVAQEKQNGEWRQTTSSNFTVYPNGRMSPDTLRKQIESYLKPSDGASD